MMAEYISEDDNNDKNFILAKLMSVFGDSVDFDVINIVAQENEWNEAECFKSLKVLGDYKNPQSTASEAEIEDFTLCDAIGKKAQDNQRIEAVPSPTIVTMSQNKKHSQCPVAASKAPKTKPLVSETSKSEPAITRQHSPSPLPMSQENQQHHDQVKTFIQSGTPVIILLRGLPGSGKSTLSKQLLSLPGGKFGCCCSADNFFLVPSGIKGQKEYRYDPLRLSEAHEDCRLQVLRAIAHGVSPIIIDNTNTQAWEMLPYVEMALEPRKSEDKLRKKIANGTIPKKNICKSLGSCRSLFKGKKCDCGYTVMDPVVVPYQVELLEPLTWWYRNPSRLAKVNQHGVSQKKITQMLSHFEFGLTGKDLIKQVLNKKLPKNSAATAPPYNHPGVSRVRPFKENKPSAHLPSSPLHNVEMKKHQRNSNVKNVPNQYIPKGSNFPYHSGQLKNIAGFPAGHSQPSSHFSSSVFSTGFSDTSLAALLKNQSSHSSGDQSSVSNFTELGSVDPKEQFCDVYGGEGNLLRQSSSTPSLFPGVKPSTLFSSKDNPPLLHDTESDSHSEKSDKIGHNPFLQSLSPGHQKSSSSSVVTSEYVEMTEEEEREWMEANASKYVNWKSSDDESVEECDEESNDKPKPARSSRRKCRTILGNFIKGRSPDGSDKQSEEEDEDMSEWIMEGDHLASWDISSTPDSGGQTSLNDNNEPKNQGPLPPRSSKKRTVMVEDTPKANDDVKQSEKDDNPKCGNEFDWIKDLPALIKALGLDKEDSNATKQTSGTIAKKLAANKDNERHNNSSSASVTRGSLCSASSEFEDSSDVESEYLSTTVKPLPPGNINGVNPLTKLDSAMEMSCPIGNVSKNDQSPSFGGLSPSAVSDTVEVRLDDIPNCRETSGLCLDDFNVDHCAVKDGVQSDVSHIAHGFGVSEELKSKSLENNDLNFLHSDVDEEDSKESLVIKTDEDLQSSSTEVRRDSDEYDKVKISVLESLLLEIEKAHKRSQEEFEISKSYFEIGQSVTSKSDINPSQTENKKDQCLENDDVLPEMKSSIESNVHEKCEMVVEVPDAGQGSVFCIPLTTACVGKDSDEQKELGTTVDGEVASYHQHEQSNFGFAQCEGTTTQEVLVKNCAECMNEPSLVSFSNPPSGETSPIILKQSNDTSESKVVGTVDITSAKETYNEKDSVTLVINSDTGVCDGSDKIFKSEKPSNSFETAFASGHLPVDEVKHEETLLNEQGDIMDQTSGTNVLLTALNMFEAVRNTLVDSKWTKNDKASTLDETCLEQNDDVAVAKTSDSFVDTEEYAESEELQNDMSSTAVESENINDCDDDEETIPLVLDPNFVELLYRNFGNPYEESLYKSTKQPAGQTNEVKVNIPTSLARKLHEFLLKSQWDAILAEEEVSQKMVMEDELLARQLQELENEDLKDMRDQGSPSSNTPNLREIMDMEMAMAMYKADQYKEARSNQRNDMSAHLTWDLLIKEFPQIPQNVIAQIFSAYDYSYVNAREALLSSLPEYERDTHERAVRDLVSSEAIAAQEKALLEKAKLESLKFQQREQLELGEEEEEDEAEGSWEEMVDEARKCAALNQMRQKERHAQAQAANRSGMASAAAYYCQLANLHKQKAEEASRKAANILAKVFTGKDGRSKGNGQMSQPPLTLDMHSMTVLEAVRVMNAFVDAHVEWLQAEKSRQHTNPSSRKSSPTKTVTLFLVTGRGVNSLGGIPRIKPAVERQLEKRGIWYEEMNPGLLRVMVSANLTAKKKSVIN